MTTTLTDLMETLDFTQADLDANRSGVLTERQRQQLQPGLWAQRLSNGCVTLGVLAGLTLCPASIALQVWQGYNNSGNLAGLVVALIFTGLAIGGFFIGLAGAFQERRGSREAIAALRRDLDDGVVAVLRATITSDEVGEHLYATDDTSQLNIVLYVENDIMQVGERYLIYYAPHSEWVLAAEPLDNQALSPQ